MADRVSHKLYTYTESIEYSRMPTVQITMCDALAEDADGGSVSEPNPIGAILREPDPAGRFS